MTGEGWAQEIILNRWESIQPEVLEALETRLGSCNPGVLFHRPVNGRVMHEGERESVLALGGFSTREQWFARQRSHPMWLTPAACSPEDISTQTLVEGVVIDFKPCVNKIRFAENLMAAMQGGVTGPPSKHGPPSPPMSIYRVKAFVLLEGGEKGLHSEFDAMGGRMRCAAKRG